MILTFYLPYDYDLWENELMDLMKIKSYLDGAYVTLVESVRLGMMFKLACEIF